MRWQRRLKSYFSDDRTLFGCITAETHTFFEHLSPTDESACNPKPKSLRQAERDPLNVARNVLAKHSRKFPVRVVDKQKVLNAFGVGQQIMKYKTACLLVKQIPVLHWELPPKRKIWESEDYRMSMFAAAALAMAYLR
jgi:hypothetical protein